MELENTLENKAKFFAQYWGQKVRQWHNENISIGVVGSTFIIKPYLVKSHLLLKPLSSITDEDLNFIRPLVGYKDSEDGFLLVKRWLSVLYKDEDEVNYFAVLDCKPTLRTLNIIDYLRSKGYALPFHNLSVQNLIDYKWIVLKDGSQ